MTTVGSRGMKTSSCRAKLGRNSSVEKQEEAKAWQAELMMGSMDCFGARVEEGDQGDRKKTFSLHT